MLSQVAFTVLILLVGLERLLELAISTRNARWALSQGGVESGVRHFPFMVTLHTALLVGAVAEVWLLDRPFVAGLGIPLLVVALACQGFRYWCITTLGRQWNTRVIVVPGLPLVRGAGPYRWLRHPNYVVVVLEGVALPLVHSAWVTAVAFTALNLPLLAVRLRSEEAALKAAG